MAKDLVVVRLKKLSKDVILIQGSFAIRIAGVNAVINETTAEQIRVLFQSYLSGDSLATAAKKAGIKAFHSGIGRMLRNTRYVGDEFYPPIIDQDTFSTA
ncbi:MAG: hypothetical protein RJR35_05330 [Thermoanaerobacterales bacterium]|nr:hypothetical protein [Thermoanaerobacterales bacterium]